jgi:DNA invertase Pin-like site-specific DNA recombinase
MTEPEGENVGEIKQAAAYIRVSTEDQTEYSPDAQRKALLKYARENGYVISDAAFFIDEGISGRKAEKRPGRTASYSSLS